MSEMEMSLSGLLALLVFTVAYQRYLRFRSRPESPDDSDPLVRQFQESERADSEAKQRAWEAKEEERQRAACALQRKQDERLAEAVPRLTDEIFGLLVELGFPLTETTGHDWHMPGAQATWLLAKRDIPGQFSIRTYSEVGGRTLLARLVYDAPPVGGRIQDGALSYEVTGFDADESIEYLERFRHRLRAMRTDRIESPAPSDSDPM